MPLSRTDHEMNMIAHQAPPMNSEAFVLLAKFQAFNNYIFVSRPCKHIDPIYHRKGDKMSLLVIMNFKPRHILIYNLVAMMQVGDLLGCYS